MRLITSIPVLLILATTSGAKADPMAGWLHQQAMAYQRARAVKGGGLPRASTSTTLLQNKVLAKKQVRPTAKAKVKPETVEEVSSSTENAPPPGTTEAAPQKTATAPSPSAAYRLGRLVRRWVQAFESDPAKPKAEPKPQAPTVAASNEPQSIEAVASRFEPEARVTARASNPGTLFLLRRARLITAADYQLGLLQFLGAR